MLFSLCLPRSNPLLSIQALQQNNQGSLPCPPDRISSGSHRSFTSNLPPPQFLFLSQFWTPADLGPDLPGQWQGWQWTHTSWSFCSLRSNPQSLPSSIAEGLLWSPLLSDHTLKGPLTTSVYSNLYSLTYLIIPTPTPAGITWEQTSWAGRGNRSTDNFLSSIK